MLSLSTPLLKRLRVPTALLLCAGLPLATQAGRPLATEDAGVLEPASCEWEAFAATERATATPVVRSQANQVGCGVGWRSQLALGYSRARDGDQREHGLSLSGKTGLVDGGEDATSLTLAYGVNLLRDNSRKQQLDTTVLVLVATRPLATGWVGHANLGWQRSRLDRTTSTTWNLAVEYTFAEGWDAGLETYGDDHGRPWRGLGLRWTLTEALSLNASAAVQSGAERPRLVTLGGKWAF